MKKKGFELNALWDEELIKDRVDMKQKRVSGWWWVGGEVVDALGVVKHFG